jgi:serine protease AprX
MSANILYDKYDKNKNVNSGENRSLKTKGKFSVIIYGEGSGKEHWKDLVTNLKYRGCNIKEYIAAADCYCADISIDDLEEIKRDNQVAMVTVDREVRALLDVACPTLGVNRIWNQTQYTGEGIGIAIIDSGIHPHPDLTKPNNRLVAFVDFVNGKTTPYDDNGHGTHVAGIAAGNGYLSSGKYKGVAPNASIIGVKGLNSRGSGSESNVLRSIQWCIDNRSKYNIKVMTLSLGAEASVPPEKDSMVKALTSAWRSGIFVTVAAGNSGPNGSTINTPGITPTVLTVGAMDDKNTIQRQDDTIADFSSRGPAIGGHVKPDVVAPGRNIISLGVRNQQPANPFGFLFSFLFGMNQSLSSVYTSKSGTSMATPFCSGIAALLYEKNPNLSPDEVKRIIINSSHNTGLDKYVQGYGYVDAFSALNSR